MIKISVRDFSSWRNATRNLIADKMNPEKIIWSEEAQNNLFETQAVNIIEESSKIFSVPKEFLNLAENVAYYRSQEKWGLLYRVLWRIIFEERNLIKIFTDKDVHKLYMMEKAVKRDTHKMKAFVRFRSVSSEENSYIAWHEPSHFVLKKTAPFFQRRFTAMNWAILTPDECAYWNGVELKFSEGLPREAAPKNDDMEELWKTFYRNIFNPARIKIKMMKSEMPVKYWHTMPETALIPEMLAEAQLRVEKMIELSNNSLR